MAALKLTYFDFKGRAELPRLIMAAGGKKYEDYRYKDGEFAQVKDKLPFGQVPTLHVDGVCYSQSIAISRYLAKECGFYGKTNLEQLAIDQWVDVGSDLLDCAVAAIKENDEAKKAEIWTKFGAEDSPKFFAFFEKGLAGSKSGFFTGEMSLADLFLYELKTGMVGERMPALDKFPNIKKCMDQVGANPGLKAYMAARK